MRNEKGAIIVEATISFTAFIFAIFTILSVVNIYYAQAKIGVALNLAAKEISQYSYLYYKFGLDGFTDDVNAGSETARETAFGTIDGVGAIMDNVSGAKQAVQTADFDALMSSIENNADNVDSLATMYADNIASDPKGFIFGMGKLALSEGLNEGKEVLAGVMAKAFMNKNLKSYDAEDPEAFLKRLNVKNMNFNNSVLMPGTISELGGNEIRLVANYEIEVIKLLDIDFTFRFCQVAQTEAWGNGVRNVKELPKEGEKSK